MRKRKQSKKNYEMYSLSQKKKKKSIRKFIVGVKVRVERHRRGLMGNGVKGVVPWGQDLHRHSCNCQRKRPQLFSLPKRQLQRKVYVNIQGEYQAPS